MKKQSKNRVKKQRTVKEISEKIKKSKSIIFVDYKGLNVAQTTALRNQMREAGLDYKVYKNNLMKLALKSCKIEVDDEMLQNTLAVAFNYNDEVAAAKILKDTITKTKKMELKFGVLENNFVDAAFVKNLASIPSREVLISKLMFLLKAPIQKFAICVDQIAQKQN